MANVNINIGQSREPVTPRRYRRNVPDHVCLPSNRSFVFRVWGLMLSSSTDRLFVARSEEVSECRDRLFFFYMLVFTARSLSSSSNHIFICTKRPHIFPRLLLLCSTLLPSFPLFLYHLSTPLSFANTSNNLNVLNSALCIHF